MWNLHLSIGLKINTCEVGWKAIYPTSVGSQPAEVQPKGRPSAESLSPFCAWLLVWIHSEYWHLHGLQSILNDHVNRLLLSIHKASCPWGSGLSCFSRHLKWSSDMNCSLHLRGFRTIKGEKPFPNTKDSKTLNKTAQCCPRCFSKRLTFITRSEYVNLRFSIAFSANSFHVAGSLRDAKTLLCAQLIQIVIHRNKE